MAYQQGTPYQALKVAATNAANTAFLRRIGRASLDFDFERLSGKLRRQPGPELAATAGEIRMPTGSGQWGETPLIDLVMLCSLVKTCRPNRVFEFGTFTGNATLAMAMNAPDTAQIFTLDLPPNTRANLDGLNWEAGIDDSIVGSCYRRTKYAGRITQLFADSRQFDTNEHRGSTDFIWIDACHEYEFVVNDSRKAFEMIRSGGVVAWHDYSRACPGVVKCVLELSQTHEITWIDGTQVVYCRV